jgi:hypothetical protein
MPKNNYSKIAVVIGGSDICRLVPFKPADGKYEIKIDFLGNEFDVIYYTLFAVEPVKWNLNNSKQMEITYHKGENAKPLIIHLKHKTENSYHRLPLRRIQAPDVNQLFPIPLFKIEVPENIDDRLYIPKDYHRVIKPDNCNVIEIYMAHAELDLDELGVKLPAVQLAFMMLSFEIYATNTTITGQQKYINIMPTDTPRHFMTSVSVFDDMQIIAIHYTDPTIDRRLSKINVTFIENELSEAILAMMQIRYPPYSRNGIFDYCNLGGATLRDVNQPTIPMMQPPIGENNVIADSLRRGIMSSEEREKLCRRALELRIQLRNALKESERIIDDK